MGYISEIGRSFAKAVIVLAIVGVVSAYGIYLCQKIINESDADEIINTAFKMAEQEKSKFDSDDSSTEEEDMLLVQDGRLERKGYLFTVKDDSTPALIKVETGKKSITVEVCKDLKRKFMENQWKDVFEKVLIIDRMGEEKTNILIYDCPHERIWIDVNALPP